jgi:hypothetical protein
MLKQCSASVGSHIFTATYIGRCFGVFVKHVQPSHRTVQLSRELQATTTAELQSSSHATISTFPTSTREHYARVLHGDVPVHRNVQPNHESKGDTTSIEVWLRTETRHLLSGVCFFLCLFQQNRTFTRIVLLCTRAVSCST